MSSIKLSPKKILNKQFQIDFKGYNPSEVDHFLDLVSDDYNAFAVMLNDSYEKIEALTNENTKLKESLRKLEKEHAIQQDQLGSIEDNLSQNIDLLKRISNLEKEVYKNR